MGIDRTFSCNFDMIALHSDKQQPIAFTSFGMPQISGQIVPFPSALLILFELLLSLRKIGGTDKLISISTFVNYGQYLVQNERLSK